MKWTVAAVLVAASAWAIHIGTQDTDESLAERLNDQVASRWIYDDWNLAKSRAAKEGKPILAVFRCVP